MLLHDNTVPNEAVNGQIEVGPVFGVGRAGPVLGAEAAHSHFTFISASRNGLRSKKVPTFFFWGKEVNVKR